MRNGIVGPSGLVRDGRPPLDQLTVVAPAAPVGHRTEARAAGSEEGHRRLEVVDRDRECREATPVHEGAQCRRSDRGIRGKVRIRHADELEIGPIRQEDEAVVAAAALVEAPAGGRDPDLGLQLALRRDPDPGTR